MAKSSSSVKSACVAKSACIALAAMVVTSLFEAGKSALFQHLSLWQSHAITIGYCSIVAGLVAIIVLHLRQRELAAVDAGKENFDAAIEYLPGLTCVISRNRFVRWNSRFQSLLGYSGEELSKIAATDTLAPEFREVVPARMMSAFDFGHGELEAAYLTRNGQKIPCYLAGVPVVVGNKPCILSMGIDLRERQRAEEALRTSEEQYRRLLSNLPDITWTIDAHGRVCYISSNVEEILGYNTEEVLGGDMALRLSRVHPEDFPTAKKALDALFLQNRYFDVEYRILHKDGRWIWVCNRAVRSYRLNGELFADGVIVDISRRKQAEALDAQLASIVRSSINAIIGKNIDGIIQSWNPAAETMFGYSPEEAIGQSIAMLVPPERRHEVEEIMGKIAKSVPIERFDSVCQRKDGSRLEVSLAISPIVDTSGKLLGISTVAHDISERKRAEAELVKAKEVAEDANRAKTQFLANMSHELRTPMNGILGMAGLALETALTAEQREYLVAIHASGHALLRLINELLDFTRTEFGSLHIVPAPFRLRETLRQTVRPLFAQAEHMGLDTSWELDPELPDDVVGDPARLRQVLVNILGNAIKFTHQGKIALRADCQSCRDNVVGVLFTLSDTGIGIPADKHHLIFEPFRQNDGSTTRRYGGTGLGLAIASRLVELMGGKIWLESEPGRGSTFYFTVRLECAVASAR